MSGVMTLASNGVFNILAGGGNGFNGLVLTNYGTVNWSNTPIYCINAANAQIYNYGLWNAQSDDTFAGGLNGGTTLFDNFGTFRKSGNTNITILDGGVVFNNTGTINVQSGTLDLIGGGASSGGNMITAGGGVINFDNYIFTNGTTFTGVGSFVAGGAAFGGTIAGTLNWDGGSLSGVLTVASNGILNIVAGGGNGFNGLVLTNYGTVNWSNTPIYGINAANAQIYNYGLWNAQSDDTFSGGLNGGTTLFDNFGTFRKSGNTNITTLTGAVVFNNTGTVNVQNGTLAINEGTSSGGGFTTASGEIINFDNYIFTNTTTFTGVGSFLAGNANFGGTIAGTLTWDAGSLTGVMTVASNGVFDIVAGAGNGLNGLVLTNYGTVNWTNTTIYGINAASAQIYNYGLWNAQSDDTFAGGLNGGTTLFDNFGTFRKSGNTGATILDANVVFNNTGTVNVQSGTLTINGGSNGGSGTFTAANGASLGLYNYTLPNSATISGSVVLGGNLTIDGVLTAPNMQLVSGILSGTNVLVGTLTWSGGEMSGVMTLASNGVLNIVAGGGNGFNGLVLTNYGTVNWSNTPIYGIGGANAQIYNYGLWNAQSDDTFGGGLNGGTTLFDNFGTFRKSGNTNITILDGAVVFNNTGTINVQSGTLDLVGGGASSGGNMITANGGTINFDSYLFTNGTTFTGVGSFVAGGAAFGGTIAGTLNWDGGSLSGVLTVASNGILNIVAGGGNGFNGLVLTNYGTVNWSNTPIYGINAAHAQIYNYGLWNAQSDDTFGGGLNGGTTLFDNFGTFRKSGSTNITTLDGNVVVNNSGTLDSQVGNISLQGPYNLTNGTLNFGINNLTNYGTISLAGAASLTGTVSANLNNGYKPIGGNSFTNLYYASSTGAFTNVVLPFADAWSTNYTATYFYLVVLNARPTLNSVVTQTVNELTLLTVTNTATDPDLPAQTLIFSLVSAPSGMAINSSTGVITWTPAQTNSPSTNTVTVSVTDNGVPALSATNSFTVIVKEVNVAPTLPAVASQTVNVLALLTVTNAASETNIHSSAAGYGLIAPPTGASINSSGIITWTPTQSEGPSTNTLTTVVTNFNPYDLANPNLKATNSFVVIVYAPTLAPIGNFTVNAGQTVSFTASATDNDHTRTLLFSLGAAPSTATINAASGLFNWRPPAASANSTNAVQVEVTANSTPSDTVTQSFQIVVNPLTPVTLTPVSKTAAQFQMQVTGPIGPDYILQASGPLTSGSWLSLLTNTPSASPFSVTTTNLAPTNEFYRIKLGP